MDKDQRLFELLSDGEFHSGEVIANLFGVTRSRVWSLVNSLEEKGVVVSRVRGKGYRYRGGSALLNIETISDSLSGTPAYYFPSVTSTNDVAKEYAKSMDRPLLVTSEYQTGGRGRRGRVWASCYAHNLMFTYAIPNFNASQGLGGLSLVVGITIAEVVRNKYKLDAKVKWPNDLLINYAKLAGILVEIQGDMDGLYTLLIGVGINVNEKPDIEDRAVTSLASELGTTLDRTALLAELVSALQENVKLFQDEGFIVFSERWDCLDAFKGMDVQLEQAGVITSGVACGVDDSGVLLLNVNGQMQQVHGGEVTLRLNNG